MNATVQSLRAIPELQAALLAPHASNTSSPLPKSLSSLYANMAKTTESVVPMAFLSTLRQIVPRFGEIDRRGGHAGYAQQGAFHLHSFTSLLFSVFKNDWCYPHFHIWRRCRRVLGGDHELAERGSARIWWWEEVHWGVSNGPDGSRVSFIRTTFLAKEKKLMLFDV